MKLDLLATVHVSVNCDVDEKRFSREARWLLKHVNGCQ